VNRNEGIVKEIDCAYTLTASDTRGLNRNQTQNAVIDCTENDKNLCFIDLCKQSQLTVVARCLKSRYNSGIANHKADNSGVLVSSQSNDGESSDKPRFCARAVLTPDRMEKRQNGRRFKNCGEPSFMLTCQDRMGVFLQECGNSGTVLKIKEATEKGYAEAAPGDSVNIAFPDSKTRRGRVGKGEAKTLETSCNQGTTFVGCGRIRRLTPREAWRFI